MKKKITVIVFVVAMFIGSISPTFAAGGKVRGEEGQGPVNQVQVQDPPPFQP